MVCWSNVMTRAWHTTERKIKEMQVYLERCYVCNNSYLYLDWLLVLGLSRLGGGEALWSESDSEMAKMQNIKTQQPSLWLLTILTESDSLTSDYKANQILYEGKFKPQDSWLLCLNCEKCLGQTFAWSWQWVGAVRSVIIDRRSSRIRQRWYSWEHSVTTTTHLLSLTLACVSLIS